MRISKWSKCYAQICFKINNKLTIYPTSNTNYDRITACSIVRYNKYILSSITPLKTIMINMSVLYALHFIYGYAVRIIQSCCTRSVAQWWQHYTTASKWWYHLVNKYSHILWQNSQLLHKASLRITYKQGYSAGYIVVYAIYPLLLLNQ
jgi:hypothetical protein